jgi:hypothetical protein
MRTLAEYTKWMRDQIAIKKAEERKTFDVLFAAKKDLIGASEAAGAIKAYDFALSLLDSIHYGRKS